MKNKKIPNTPKYKFGGMNSDTKKNIKDFAGNYGKLLLDNSANALGIDAVGAGKGINYTGSSADKFNKYSNVTGAISKSIAPMAMNAVIPGSGQIVSMGQQVAGGAYGQFGPQNEQGYNAYDNEGNPIVNQNDRSAQFGQMAGQIGSMAGGMMGGGSGGIGGRGGKNPYGYVTGGSGAGFKYGGQMKYAMGGMNKYPGGGMGEGNGQVELDENSIAPNGQFTQFNEPSHDAQNSNQPNASLAPGEKIFSAKLKPMGSKKSFADLNKSNNTNREDKLFSKGNLDPKSEVSLKLTMMAKMKNSDVLFNMQEQLKKDKVAAYAKKMGVQLPSMDNEQMEPQGMSEQSEGEMPMGKYGGRFAMGGVQLPYYNTDNAGNPIYAMGGGYPAMTNPYHNFKGSIPMYEDGGIELGDPPTSTGTTTKTYKPSLNFKNENRYTDYMTPDEWVRFNTERNYTVSPVKNTRMYKDYYDPLKYTPILKRRDDNGELYTWYKKGDEEKIVDYNNDFDYRPEEVYGGPRSKPSVRVEQKPYVERQNYRQEVFGDYGPNIKVLKYFNEAGGFNKPTTVAYDKKTGQEINWEKSFDSKGNYIANTIQDGRNYFNDKPDRDNSIKTVNLGDLEKKKYGGQMQMPKFWGGGDMPSNFNFERSRAFNKEQNQKNLAFNQMTGNTNPEFSTYNSEAQNTLPSSYAPGTMGYNDSMNSPQNPSNHSLQSSYGPSVLPWDRTNDSNQGPNGAAQKYTMENPTQQFQEATTSGLPNITQTNSNLNNKPNWMDIVGKGVNFAAQNAGNIYNLSRYDKPEEEKYERATAKYMDPTKAIANENYIYRQTKDAAPGLTGGNAGATLAVLGANKAGTSTRIGRLRETYDNANAQIGNQVNQYNTGLAQQEVIANAANRARYRSGKGEAISQIGKNYNQMALDTKKGKMDKSMMEMMPKLINNPEFQKFYTEWMKNNAGSSVA